MLSAATHSSLAQLVLTVACCRCPATGRPSHMSVTARAASTAAASSVSSSSSSATETRCSVLDGFAFKRCGACAICSCTACLPQWLTKMCSIGMLAPEQPLSSSGPLVAGAGGQQQGHALPAGGWPAHERAHRAAWALCHEHAGRDPAGAPALQASVTAQAGMHAAQTGHSSFSCADLAQLHYCAASSLCLLLPCAS